MPCFHPQTVYRSKEGRDKITGKWPIVFKKENGYEDLKLVIPCQQCWGCRLERSRIWAIRCVHENQLYENSEYVTLTYDDKHLPKMKYIDGKKEIQPSLLKTDLQKFIKRVRKKHKIRYYSCGEYGEKNARPHYHIIMFGLNLNDRKYYRHDNGNNLYTSATLQKLWNKGHVVTGNVTYESCAYVARYIMKKRLGKDKDTSYMDINHETGVITNEREKEFTTMSLGIGKEWYKQFKSDIYAEGSEGKLTIRGGKSSRPPKYYEDRYEKRARLESLQGDSSMLKNLLTIKSRRKGEAIKKSLENTPERLAVKEKIFETRIKQLKRSIEQ